MPETFVRTTSWTPEQKELVDKWVQASADEIAARIKRIAPVLQDMDVRPRQTYTDEEPDVYFPYAAQAMLEDLVAELASRI